MTTALPLTAKRFFENWHNTTLNERQSYQAHFIELCQMMGYPHPTGTGRDAKGNIFKFEESGDGGFADVYLEGHFAIEYKAPEKYKDLNAAYSQLQKYREQLKNPPLLIVTDIARWEIHTNFESSDVRVYEFTHNDLSPDSPNYRLIWSYLDAMFDAPRRLHPDYNTAALTLDAAKGFQRIADQMRLWQTDPTRIAHFLTKVVFCLFAEDIHLLPLARNSVRGIFSEIIHEYRAQPALFREDIVKLFRAMADGGREFMVAIPYFNGSLFDQVDVVDLQLEELNALHQVSLLDWSQIEPAIFGTLFEGALDKSKRAQLGAHYTSREDILLIIEPVLMTPLRRAWADIKAQAAPLHAEYQMLVAQSATPRAFSTLNQKREALRQTILERVRTTTVLDPACGSGNFLYVSLQRLMSLEKEIIMDDVWQGLSTTFYEVHPRQMYGLEKDPIAHALASIVVWIGYIQWRAQNITSGFGTPILQDLSGQIRCTDAILHISDEGTVTEPEWPATTVIVGNPPFLGDKKMRGELGSEYVTQLRTLYQSRVPGGADLVTYWFEKARAMLESGKTQRVGLLTTQSIRQGANRKILERIKESGDIFMAWADRPWILEGAAVRVSMVGFDKGDETDKVLDGQAVSIINSDLSAKADLTSAKSLSENRGLVFQGPVKVGAFDIDNAAAAKMIGDNNIYRDVVFPYLNASDIVQSSRNYWIIDFGNLSEKEAEKYPLALEYVRRVVKPERDKNNDKQRRNNWWRLGRSGSDYKKAKADLTRQIFTPRVSKHRIFVWTDKTTVPDSRVNVITRDDDYFFGVLHSRLHEIWTLHIASRHGVGNDPTYNSESCFETFPFPYIPGKEPTDDPCYQAIAAAAKQLHEERQAWLTPNQSSGDRSIQASRGQGGGKQRSHAHESLQRPQRLSRQGKNSAQACGRRFCAAD